MRRQRLTSCCECSMGDGVRRFGRARHLTAWKRLKEIALGVAYSGGWPARLAKTVGLQGTFRVATHFLSLPCRTPDAPPLRVAFASDLHAGPSTHPALIVEACRALAESAAHLLLLGGDFVGFHARYIDDLVPVLAAIEPPLGKFAVLGNHDLMADDAYIAARLEAAGVRVLVNESVRLPAPHAGIWLCGLDDWDEGAPDAEAAFAGTDGLRLVLMHSPDGLQPIGAERPFAVAFCGHTHGGQFLLPAGRALVTPKGALSRRYLRGGIFRVGPQCDRLLLVSRGIGCTTLPLRRGADPEVHICRLEFSNGASTPAA
jgi:uncharacterized protein